MSEENIRAEIARRKEVYRREQAALPFVEKLRISFELGKRRNTLKQARLIQGENAALQLPTDELESATEDDATFKDDQAR